MGVLHFRISEKNQNINISRSIYAQSFIFKRAVIVCNPSLATTDVKNLNGGINVKLSFLNGFEILSNQNSNNIYLPFAPPIVKLVANDSPAIAANYDIYDLRYNLQFNAEQIKNSFNVEVYNYDSGSQQPEFSATSAGTIKYIDMYFEIGELNSQNNYQ